MVSGMTWVAIGLGVACGVSAWAATDPEMRGNAWDPPLLCGAFFILAFCCTVASLVV